MYKNHNYAQTNIQLYNQMRVIGYPEEDIKETFHCYEYAMKMFPANFRANGKPFLSHLIGTASVLASLKAPVEMINAGLLHSTYMFGQFKDYRDGITESKRQEMQLAVGAKVEQLVLSYTQLSWNPKTIQHYSQQIGNLTENEVTILILRLANELEDNLDNGMLYGTKNYSEFYQSSITPLKILATNLISQSFSNELYKVLSQTIEKPLFEGQRRKDKHSFSLIPVPFLRRKRRQLAHKRDKLTKALTRKSPS